MISAEYLQSIALWSRDLSEREFEQARRAIVERSYAKGAYICHRGDKLDAWAGVVSGVIKLSTVSKSGKGVTLAGIRTGGWFGEGTVLKDIPRQYDLVALRDTRMAFLDKATFLWLFEHSVALNRYLVRQFNERLGQFIALVEYDRMLDAKARLARNIAWLFNPALYPDSGNELDISQEELGLITGISRQATNESLKALEREGLVRVSHGGITVLDLGRLSRYGE